MNASEGVGRADDSRLKSSQRVAVSSPLGGFADLKELRTRREVPSVVATGVGNPPTALAPND
ncbi:hypothetical protein ACX27_06680 [Nostoc piscinale CENA21]|uniref:Uncharacterized protein n=1 Tax=Nostoc piscinale CENA21 TaxID=224013 RepID=A0A0M4T0P7_9NOSO|nr:hypothetical protein ACX27_06680 [Nostoc piscinale CENA21]